MSRTVINLTPSSSPLTLKAADFSILNNYQYDFILKCSGGAITVNLPALANIKQTGTVLILVTDGATTVTVNTSGSDQISESGSAASSFVITGNKNYAVLQGVPSSLWIVLNGGGGSVLGDEVRDITVDLGGGDNLIDYATESGLGPLDGEPSIFSYFDENGVWLPIGLQTSIDPDNPTSKIIVNPGGATGTYRIVIARLNNS
jgi:hypothetical protein